LRPAEPPGRARLRVRGGGGGGGVTHTTEAGRCGWILGEAEVPGIRSVVPRWYRRRTFPQSPHFRGRHRALSIVRCESPRVCRRLQPLRDWGHETGKEVLPRGAGAGGSDGVRARERVLLAVGCPPVYCRKDRLLW